MAKIIEAKIIEFFVPASFVKKATKWMPRDSYGKVIPFRLSENKSA
jgi:hypothetical protein